MEKYAHLKFTVERVKWGISSYCKEKNKNVKIIGVQSKNAPSMYESFEKNQIIKAPMNETICDESFLFLTKKWQMQFYYY
jgi:cysteine synthase